jgi:hypothetical protein
LREHFDYVPTNSEPSSWFPTVKITISGETYHARCDIMSGFCLMPKDVYESLSLWKLSEGGACCGGVDVNHRPVGNPKRKV